MIKEKIGELFDFISETNLTEQHFYENKGGYPVYSGQTENDGIVAYINSCKERTPCATFTTYGSAGKLSYRKEKFTIGRNCMGLKPKSKYEKNIIMEWFAFKFQNLFYRLRIGDPKGQKSLNKLLLENITINIPDKKIQKKQLIQYKKANGLYQKLNSTLFELSKLLKSKQTFKAKYKEEVGKIFKIIGGNSGLTEDFIYDNKPNDKDEIIPILSSATIENNSLGVISKNAKIMGKKLKIFNKECVLIARNGYAGTMIYLKNKKFTTNDHAYILTVRDEWKDKINLRWFVYQYQEHFYNLVTSKSDNATFNKDYAEKQIIECPDEKVQDQIAEKLLEIDYFIKKGSELKEQLEDLLEHEAT